jgi:curved DNA-binding protein CbpA
LLLNNPVFEQVWQHTIFPPNTIFAHMPATVLKDYYKILEIAPEATVQEVKKAYRAMAFKYHPDAAPGDAYAAGYFHDVQEAYAVLSDEYRRKQYDNDRWLAGMADRARKKEQVSPMWILQETIKLNNHMAGVDLYRMNHRALQDYILQLLDNNHMAILTRRETYIHAPCSGKAARHSRYRHTAAKRRAHRYKSTGKTGEVGKADAFCYSPGNIAAGFVHVFLGGKIIIAIYCCFIVLCLYL